MPRVWTPELMDDPGVDQRALERSLGYIRAVNRRLGGVEALLYHLRSWSVRWPKDRPITLLDVATGSADLPVAARRWAEQAGHDLRITGIDTHEKTLDAARQHASGVEGITLERLDAHDLLDRYGPQSFDYVHAGLFLHHMPGDDAVVRVLRSMHQLARVGLIWNDLVRTTVGKVAIHAMTIGQPEIIRHDARVSVAAGFTRREAESLAAKAGIDYARYRWSLFTHRFTLAGEKARPA